MISPSLPPFLTIPSTLPPSPRAVVSSSIPSPLSPPCALAVPLPQSTLVDQRLGQGPCAESTDEAAEQLEGASSSTATVIPSSLPPSPPSCTPPATNVQDE